MWITEVSLLIFFTSFPSHKYNVNISLSYTFYFLYQQFSTWQLQFSFFYIWVSCPLLKFFMFKSSIFHQGPEERNWTIKLYCKVKKTISGDGLHLWPCYSFREMLLFCKLARFKNLRNVTHFLLFTHYSFCSCFCFNHTDFLTIPWLQVRFPFVIFLRLFLLPGLFFHRHPGGFLPYLFEIFVQKSQWGKIVSPSLKLQWPLTSPGTHCIMPVLYFPP